MVARSTTSSRGGPAAVSGVLAAAWPLPPAPLARAACPGAAGPPGADVVPGDGPGGAGGTTPTVTTPGHTRTAVIADPAGNPVSTVVHSRWPVLAR